MIKENGGDILKYKILAIVLAIIIVGGVSAVILWSTVEGAGEDYSRFRFLVEIDGIVTTSFMEVEGLNVNVDVVKYRAGNYPTTTKLTAGLTHCGPLVLRYGVTDNMELWRWMKETLDGNMDTARRNIAVTILDSNGNRGPRYQIPNAWPSSWSLVKLDSQDEGLLIEELVIQYESLQRVD